MRGILLTIGLTLGLSGVFWQSTQGQSQLTDEPRQEDSKAPPADKHSADEAAIRANIAQFVKAYNAGDAKAVAALFTPDGKAVDDDGNESEGREQIEQDFAKVFAANPKKHIEVDVESILFIGSDL